MKKKISVILINVLLPIMFLSIGYGSWEKKLIIKGSIEVVKPKPKKVQSSIPVQIDRKIIRNTRILENENKSNDLGIENKSEARSDTESNLPINIINSDEQNGPELVKDINQESK